MADVEFDPNKIAAEVFTQILKDSANSVAGLVKAPVQKLVDAYRFSMKDYIKNTLTRCSKIKTFLNRDEPINLKDAYVNINLKCGNNKYDDYALIRDLSKYNNVLILGTAGSGKSMFMRYLLISLCEHPAGRIPLFIELRHLTGIHSKDLTAFIYHSVITPGGVATIEQFHKGLESGLFTLVLDGFDEIDFDERKDVEKQILLLRDKYSELMIIVSSREDERFKAWNNFFSFHVLPLEKEQVVSLISKSQYDQDVKRKFVKALKEELFERHRSFLSNPLLAVMMLITFREIAHIPEKLHIFYDQAFEALFFKHDASKEAAFRRKIHSGLPIDDFKNCVSCFSIITYVKERFSFLESQIRDDLKKAVALAKIDVRPEKLLSDLLESVCILQRDGLHIVFAHRSFQEYFSAYFISRNPSSSSLEKLIDGLCRRNNDIVLRLVFDMNKPLIEREWVLRKLVEYKELVDSVDLNNDIAQYCAACFGPLEIHLTDASNNRLIIVGNNPPAMGFSLQAMTHLYPDLFQSLRTVWLSDERDQRALKSIFYRRQEKKQIKTSGGVVGQIASKNCKIAIEDNELLKKTRLAPYIKAHHAALVKLESLVRQNVESQESLVESLFD